MFILFLVGCAARNCTAMTSFPPRDSLSQQADHHGLVMTKPVHEYLKQSLNHFCVVSDIDLLLTALGFQRCLCMVSNLLLPRDA